MLPHGLYYVVHEFVDDCGFLGCGSYDVDCRLC